MWHDSSRKGGEQFSLAGNKCTSLSLGLQPAKPSALQMEWEKWEDVTFPEAAEVQMAYFSHAALKRITACQWYWFCLEVSQDHHMTNIVYLKRDDIFVML